MLSLFSLANTAPLAASATDAAQTSQAPTLFSIVLEKLPGYSLAIIIAGLSFFVARFLANFVQNKIIQNSYQEEAPPEIVYLAKRLVFISVFTLGVVTALSLTGLLGNIGWLFGSFGLAIGFALQGVMTNFVAGLMMLAQRKTSIGNYIHVSNVEGTIIEIGTRATLVQTLDGVEILVPNKVFIDNVVTIFTSNPYRRLTVLVGVDYSTDLSVATKVVKDLLSKREELVKELPSDVLVASFEESEIALQVRFWVSSHVAWWTIQSDITKAVKEAFDANNIAIPFPQRVVHVAHDVQNVLKTNAENSTSQAA